VSQTPGKARPSLLARWGRLLRLPNLFTVPGDPLAGFAAAAVALRVEAVYAALASVCLYCAGLIANDLFDYREDLRDRPDRPLPAGAIGKAVAVAATGIFAAIGLSLAFVAHMAAGICAAGLLGMILLYNALAKRHGLAGPATMGLCRAGSVLVGTFAAVGFSAPSVLAWTAAGTIGLYIAAVTSIARLETQQRRIGWIRLAPAAAAGIWAGLLLVGSLAEILAGQMGYFLVAVLALLAVSWAVQCAKLLRGRPEPARVQQVIGMLIRGLLILQAGFLATLSIGPDGSFRWTGALVAGGVLILWPVASVASRRFYAS
jgi:4-hydroxybenzoate polyprenyltransferase